MDLMEINDSVHMKKSLTKDGFVTKVDLHGRKPPSRRASVCLGLMCTLLFAANIGQFLYYYTFIKPMSEDLIQTAHSTGEQLKIVLSNVTKDKEQLQQSCNTFKQEKHRLQTDYSSLETVRDDLTREKKQLQQSYNILKQEKDQLQTNYENTQRNLNNLQREKNDLQTQFNTTRTNRDELQRSNAALKSEKDQLQSQFNSLQREKDQLRTDYNSVTQVRDQLQQRVNELANPCQGCWKRFGSSNFYVSTQRSSWSSSRDFCISKGGHLAILNDKDKMMFVNGLLGPGSQVWIGLTDSVREGTWKWVDGSRVTTTFWGNWQPNSWNGNQDCGLLMHQGKVGEWNDFQCEVTHVFVCEKTL